MGKYAKAWLAFAIAGVGALATAAVDNQITLGEGMTSLSAALTALGVVYAVKNAPADPKV